MKNATKILKKNEIICKFLDKKFIKKNKNNFFPPEICFIYNLFCCFAAKIRADFYFYLRYFFVII